MATNANIVTPQSEILLEYVLSTEDEILETTEGVGPLRLALGTGRLHPAIEACLVGLKQGDSFERMIHHTLAFGERNPDLRISLKREGLPKAAQTIKEGDMFEAPGPDRKSHLFRVIWADQDSFMIDGNHALAGIDLHFEGKIIDLF